MAAFEKAVELGSLCLEFDVMLSADEQPFVFHDDHLWRTSNGRGDIGQVNAEYLQSLDAGGWFARRFRGEKIPHLREVLIWLVEVGITANIEIKPYPGTSEQTTIAVLSHINQYWPHSKPSPLISSFDLNALKLARSLAPELPLGLLFHKWDKDWLIKAKDLQAYSVHVHKSALNKARVEEIKAAGFRLYIYTVNRRRQARKFFLWGADAVFSDYPDLL